MDSLSSCIALKLLLLLTNPEEIHDLKDNHKDSEPKEYPMSYTHFMDAQLKNITKIHPSNQCP
ncbi:MAG: hypothetical protein MJY94_03565 [Bacteroidales bacterium]|nr:hypothetical protein [Bacteroidales bacterium]